MAFTFKWPFISNNIIQGFRLGHCNENSVFHFTSLDFKNNYMGPQLVNISCLLFLGIGREIWHSLSTSSFQVFCVFSSSWSFPIWTVGKGPVGDHFPTWPIFSSISSFVREEAVLQSILSSPLVKYKTLAHFLLSWAPKYLLRLQILRGNLSGIPNHYDHYCPQCEPVIRQNMMLDWGKGTAFKTYLNTREALAETSEHTDPLPSWESCPSFSHWHGSGTWDLLSDQGLTSIRSEWLRESFLELCAISSASALRIFLHIIIF